MPQLFWCKAEKWGVVSKFDDGDSVYVPPELDPTGPLRRMDFGHQF
jgi:hypothetical protein